LTVLEFSTLFRKDVPVPKDIFLLGSVTWSAEKGLELCLECGGHQGMGLAAALPGFSGGCRNLSGTRDDVFFLLLEMKSYSLALPGLELTM
jgi:O-succinylbenzoate synthase